MFTKGHIIVKRTIKEWGWYSNAKVFTVFVHLLIEANFKDGNWEQQVIKRGELVTSIQELATICGLSIQEIRTCLKILGGAGEVRSRRVGRRSILTICKYDDYQTDQQDDNKIATSLQQDTNNSLTSQQPSIIEEGNNGNKKKKKDSSKEGSEDELKFPYTSEKFMELWNTLCKQPKWKGKTIHALQMNLNDLARFDEEFACILMADAIKKNYQGIVYDSTADRYEKWKQAQASQGVIAFDTQPEPQMIEYAGMRLSKAEYDAIVAAQRVIKGE